MPIVKDPQAFDGHANYAASGLITLKTSFGGSTEPYPLALLEDTACDAAYPIRDSAIDSAHHDQTIHSIVHENTVRCCNDSDTPRADAHDSGWYRVITDDLIDPILLAWEEGHKIAFFPRPLAAFQHTTGHPDRDILLKTSVNFMLNTIANAPITDHYAPTTCNFPNLATTFFAPNHNPTGNHSPGTFSPNVLNPISGDSIQPIAHATVSNVQVAPAAGSSTLIKCRECKVGTA
ncbi:hypothetical protein GE21DRAFT_5040 [Neurospora crassa]|uniref:Uncharacterized protein n=1 Tax=Neurospora crassa (strain ATCC 24698 / 74-OR23-1A / CBS 708.71 / DSM 1257 / FGSC 987) TaxID=367110 RepID=Q7S3I6_NEUCR|nr:hypothetical protein NCU08257 [Neurospora crassa OR74A]EAA30111.3 hypothetical protein NCU08257 [Neurospora crassa OR74A]KHE86516.1 hypothetical protein GE21DRAFT_5040 [Neurospora crassa]|eukprot:XP_959347.3 hypothetical protein NCU08257 [Neurospora crassa OR74A]